MRDFKEFTLVEHLDDIVRNLREDGYNDDEIEEILILVERGHSIDAAMQWNMD